MFHDGVHYFITGLFLTSLLSVISAIAPGDENMICTHSLNVNHTHPSNVKVLMDSYNYIHLLEVQPNGSPLWRYMDNDRNNMPGTKSRVCYLRLILYNNYALSVYSGIRLPTHLVDRVCMYVASHLAPRIIG